MALLVAVLGAAGGLLAAIILSSVLDNLWLGGPLTPVMMIAGAQVIVAISNYTFDATPPGDLLKKDSDRPAHRTSLSGSDDEEIALIETKDRDGSENDDSDQNHQPVADGNRR
jgi:hypothetical protein